MKIAFLIDPPETLHIEKDTSFALMLAAQERGHEIFILERGNLSLHLGALIAILRRTKVADVAGNAFTLDAPVPLPAAALDILFIRTDPPFDTNYLTDTWLLSHATAKPLVLNAPNGLRTINEKIWAARFSDLTPATLITANAAEFHEFLNENARVVLKPADGFGGSSIFIVDKGSVNAQVTFETLQKLGGYVIVQAYLPAATEGDKRILLLEGEILGAVLRHHSGTDHRNNFAAGGKALPTAITPTERRICERLKPYLQELGIFFAGIDIIGEKLIEINVTSPTCLREMQSFTTENLAAKIIATAEKKVVEKS
ncbi:MAG: glutathione synthase [Spirochaetes bacterium]|nr:glutathione synthase [Spirochaetota bacterium]